MKRPCWTCAVGLCFFLAIGCSEEQSTRVHANAAPVARASRDACMQIVNGRVTSDYPSVVLLANETGICTGTFIAHNAILTASHCVDDSYNGGLRYVDGTNIRSDQLRDIFLTSLPALRVYQRGPLRGTTTGIRSGQVDLAVLIFPDQTAPWATPLLERKPRYGEPLEMVGFGLTRLTGPNEKVLPKQITKRVGKNTVTTYRATPGIYSRGLADTVVDGEEHPSLSGSGDSGGPIFIDNHLAGIMSGSDRGTGLDPDTTTEGEAYSVDLNDEGARTFLDEVIAEEHLTLADEAAVSECE